MITDGQVFFALGIALIAAIFAIGLGRQLYV
jgi:photosystem I reaction center subunit XII